MVTPIDLTKEEVDLTHHFRVAIPSNDVPTFETFNISRQYRLKVKMTVECAEVKNKVEFELPGLRISSNSSGNFGHQGVQMANGYETKPPVLVDQSHGYGYHDQKVGYSANSGMAPPPLPQYYPSNQGGY